MALFFPDVSNHNTGLRLQPDTVAVFAKASQGTGFTDAAYADFKAQAAALGAVFCAYHWLEPGNLQAQAERACSIVGPDVPLMVDVESGYGDPSVADILGFVAAYRALGGRVALVYLPRWYWSGHLGSPDLRPLAGAHLALIASEYRAFDPASWPAPYGGVTPVIWQYTNAQPYAGRRVDFDAFRGSLADLHVLLLSHLLTGGTTVDVARWSTVVTGPVGDEIARLLGRAPNAGELWISSGMDGDHGPRPNGSHHYGLTDATGSPTAALDVVGNPEDTGVTPESQRRMRDVAKWLYDNFSDLIVELIHTTPYQDDEGFYVKDGVRYPGGGPYGDPGDPNSTAGQHASHVHDAMSAAGVAAAHARLDAQQQPAPAPVPPVPPTPPPAPVPPAQRVLTDADVAAVAQAVSDRVTVPTAQDVARAVIDEQARRLQS